MRNFPLVRMIFLCSTCVQCTSWPILLPVQWACVYICTVYVCVSVCFFRLCKCLCSNHGSGCVSWRRRKASFEVGPVKWAPGSCAWSWPAKITEKEIIIYMEVNVFDLFTRIYLVQSFPGFSHRQITVTLQITHITQQSSVFFPSLKVC